MRVVLMLMSALLAASVVPAEAFAAVGSIPNPAATPEAPANEIIVIYDGSCSDEMAERSARVAGGEIVEVLAEDVGEADMDVALVEVDDGVSVEEAVERAESAPGVAFAQPNHVYYLLDESPGGSGATLAAPCPILPRFQVNDPYASVRRDDRSSLNQWWLSSLGMADAWDVARSNGDVTVAVVDTGINFEHPDLAANIDFEHAYDAVTDEKLAKSPKSEEMAHGSHVAGIVSAVANNAKGIAGVSFNARILPINVFELTSGGRAYCDDVGLIRAYRYLLSDEDGDGRTLAQETNTRVVNMSLGGYSEIDRAFEALVNEAADAGIVTVCAGGNGDDQGFPITQRSFPGDYDAAISVVALDSSDERATWCDYNQFKDLAAPGIDIWSTWYKEDEYQCLSGTSMASPMVAGVAALMFSFHPELSVDDLKAALYSTADDLGTPGRDDYYGWGKVNPSKALESVGVVAISAERSEMTRTSRQQLAAYASKSAKASGTWRWESDDPSVARIDDAGVVTAVAPGVTTVRAIDPANPSVAGKREIAVTDIAVPGKVTARGSRFDWAVDVTWSQAECAVSYAVQRAGEGGGFAEIGKVAASSAVGGALAFQDGDVRAGVEYRYRIVPSGVLDGQPVEGAVSDEAVGFYTDKVALGAQIAAAQALRAATAPSADGSDVSELEMWATPADIGAFDAAVAKAVKVSYAASPAQARVDEAVSALAAAIERFKSVRRVGLVWSPTRDIARASVTLTKGATYTGKPVKAVQKVVLGGAALKAGRDYSVVYKNNVNAGTASVVLKGAGVYHGTLSKTFAIKRAANPFKLAGRIAIASAAKARRGKVVLRGATLTGNRGGAVSYGAAKFGSAAAKKRISVDKKTGKVTVKKGTPAGVYKVTVKATSAAKGNYAKTSKTAVVTVRVR